MLSELTKDLQLASERRERGAVFINTCALMRLRYLSHFHIVS